MCEQVVCKEAGVGRRRRRRKEQQAAAGGSAQPKTRTPHKDVGNEYSAVYPILRHTQVSDHLLDNLIPLQMCAAGGLKTEWWRARFNGATGSGEVMERE